MQPYHVYLITNAGNSLGQMDEAELLALSTPVTGQDGFLQNGAMYLSGMQTMTVAGNTTCRIVLRRAAAKISINVHLGPQMEDARIVHVVPGNGSRCTRATGPPRSSSLSRTTKARRTTTPPTITSSSRCATAAAEAARGY